MRYTTGFLFLLFLSTLLAKAQNHSSSKVQFYSDFGVNLTVYGSDSPNVYDFSRSLKKKVLINSKGIVSLSVKNNIPLQISVLNQEEIKNIYVRNPFRNLEDYIDINREMRLYNDKSFWFINSYPNKSYTASKLSLKLLEPMNDIRSHTLLGAINHKDVFSVDHGVVFDPVFSTANNMKEAILQCFEDGKGFVKECKEPSALEKSGSYKFEYLRIKPVIKSYSFIMTKNKKSKFSYGTGSLCVDWLCYYNQKDFVTYEINVVQSSVCGSPYQLFISALQENVKVLNHNELWLEEMLKMDSTIKNNLMDEKLNINVQKQNEIDSKKLIIKDCMEAVTTIKTKKSFGSGFIISSEGYLLTNYHVIDDADDTIKVIMNDDSVYVAKVIRFNSDYDIALLKIDIGKTPAPLFLGNSTNATVGDNVITIGTPATMDLKQTLSKGIISGKRNIEDKYYIQTDLNISPGNSGGPLINEQGEVIGMIVMKLTGRGVEGLGFAIPSDVILEKMNIHYTQ